MSKHVNKKRGGGKSGEGEGKAHTHTYTPSRVDFGVLIVEEQGHVHKRSNDHDQGRDDVWSPGNGAIDTPQAQKIIQAQRHGHTRAHALRFLVERGERQGGKTAAVNEKSWTNQKKVVVPSSSKFGLRILYLYGPCRVKQRVMFNKIDCEPQPVRFLPLQQPTHMQAHAPGRQKPVAFQAAVHLFRLTALQHPVWCCCFCQLSLSFSWA